MASRDQSVYVLGAVYVGLYVLVGSAGEVFAGHLFQEIDFVATLLLGFLLVTVVFRLMPQGGPIARTRPVLATMALINLATAGAWIGLFAGLKYLEPAIVVSFIIAVGPIATVVVNALLRKGAPGHASDKLMSVLVVPIALYLVWVSMSGRTGMTFDQASAVGVAASVLSGIAIAVNGVAIKKAFDLGVTSGQMLSHRFYLVIAVLVIAVDGAALETVVVGHLTSALLLALSTVIVPIYLIQLGIKRLEPFVVKMILLSSPLVTWLLQTFDQRLVQSPYTLAANIAILFLGAATVVLHYRRVPQ
jgi:drug/metabolite transporter (DMT)-like permease